MNKNRLLFSIIGLLGLVWVGLWISSWWGTITLQYDQKPLNTVLQSLTRQSGLKVLTDLDLTKPITIHVRRVPLAEALDALQSAAESRGRLAFVLAPDKASLRNLISSLPNPQESSDLRTIEFRMPWQARASTDDLPIERDPRNQPWKAETSLPRQLIPCLESAAQATEICLFLPNRWTPDLKGSAKSGPLNSSLPALANAVGGVSEMVYLLPARREGDQQGPMAARPSGNFSRNFDSTPLPAEAFMVRLESRIASLPSAEQADMRKTITDSAREYKEWSSMTEEEKSKKRAEMMNDPARADRMSDGFARYMRKASPEQRSQRYSGYVSRRSAAKSGQP